MPNTQQPQPDDNEDLAQRVADLENQLAAAQKRAALVPLTTVPYNGAGPGYDVHESWGLAAQESAGRGEWHDTWGDPPE